MVTFQRLGEISGRLQLMLMLLIRHEVKVFFRLCFWQQLIRELVHNLNVRKKHSMTHVRPLPSQKESSLSTIHFGAMLNFGSVLWFIYCFDSKSMSAWELQKKHPLCWFVVTKISQKMSICANSFNDFMLLHQPNSWNNVIWGKQCRIHWTTFLPLTVFSHLAFNTWHMTHHV